jgi:hypothetical protein
MTRLGIHRGPLFRLEKHRKFRPRNAWFPFFGRRTASTVFCLCVPGCSVMRSRFLYLYCLTSKGISATASIGQSFEVSTSISIMHQFTMPNGVDKKLPETKAPGSCIRLILLMLHPVTFLVWLSEEQASQRTHRQTFFFRSAISPRKSQKRVMCLRMTSGSHGSSGYQSTKESTITGSTRNPV